ncbi:11278_t:CDS:1, partial [Paraglomus brasilianum]
RLQRKQKNLYKKVVTKNAMVMTAVTTDLLAAVMDAMVVADRYDNGHGRG